MAARPPSPRDPEMQHPDDAAGYRGEGPTGGQVAFDLLFGLLAPLALLLADPAVFSTTVARRAALPPYWATPAHVFAGALLLALLAWGLSGMRSPRLGMLLAGPFALGALAFLGLGGALLPFAFTHVESLSGLVAFTPWLTAYVFGRHCVLAVRAGAERSAGATVLALIATSAAVVAALGIVASRADRRARGLEQGLMSGDLVEFNAALSEIRSPADLDLDRVAESCRLLPESDPRRERIAAAYLKLSGYPIEDALNRLHPQYGSGEKPKARPAAPKAVEDPAQARLRRLFSGDKAEHEKAVDELLGCGQKTLDEIVLRYAQLEAADPRRPRIETAYRQLAGESMAFALKRLERKAGPKEKAPEPGPEAPKTPAPPTLPDAER